jgi:succinate dehydrogenase / fumarate reductase flavoprotein subunit
MLELSHVMTLGALLRNESRGAHYKPEFPERDDDNFLKTTKATWTPDGPTIAWEDVDTSLITPRKRDYSTDKKGGH